MQEVAVPQGVFWCRLRGLNSRPSVYKPESPAESSSATSLSVINNLPSKPVGPRVTGNQLCW